MSPNNLNILHVGLDVAKLSLQLHLAGRFHSLANDAKGYAQLLKHLHGHPAVHVVCEATGGYEQASCAPCRRRASPSASSRPGVSVTSPAPTASAPRPIPLMPPCCPNRRDVSTASHGAGRAPTTATGRAVPASPPAHPTARHRAQPCRALHRCLPVAPVPATA